MSTADMIRGTRGDAGPAPQPPMALTMGDPAGIGIEITLKAWLHRRDAGLKPFVWIGSRAAAEAQSRKLGLDVPLTTVTALHEAPAHFSRSLPVLDLPLPVSPIPGEPDSRNAAATIASIEMAVRCVHAGEAAAVVTNPIAKSILYDAGFRHPGHTEFLGHLAEQLHPGRRFRPVMMLASAELRVVPLTVHVALAQVPSLVTRELIMETCHTAWAALKRDFGITAPRLALTGLNPHAGEDGNLGREDIDVIAPAVAMLRNEGLSVTGPHPADTLFHAEARRTYDAVIAMYHDQALIPLKTLAFDSGVNMTLGLPFVRTSPDHGTAFDIAGQGLAQPASLIAALKLASACASRSSRQVL